MALRDELIKIGMELRRNGTVKTVEMSSPHNDNTTHFYFSYGSNMLKERIRINDPDAQPYAAARLDGYELDFDYISARWRGAAATIIQSPESHVWGVVWVKNISSIPSLDEQEGVHLLIYKPITVRVTTASGQVLSCRSYQLLKLGYADKRPSAVYKNVLIQGARENRVPDYYIRHHLETIVDNGYTGKVDVRLDTQKLGLAKK